MLEEVMENEHERALPVPEQQTRRQSVFTQGLSRLLAGTKLAEGRQPRTPPPRTPGALHPGLPHTTLLNEKKGR